MKRGPKVGDKVRVQADDALPSEHDGVEGVVTGRAGGFFDWLVRFADGISVPYHSHELIVLDDENE